MFDFEDSAKRLKKDQSKMRGRQRKGGVVSAKAQREAEFRRKQQAKLRAERQQKQRRLEYQRSFITKIERDALKVRSLGSPALLLQPTSIWGEGDKIALPPSVLERLTSDDAGDSSVMNGGGNPWIFRIGIPNPDYALPASPLLATVKVPDDAQDMDEDEDEDAMDGDSDGEFRQSVYLDEMTHRYLAYTHCTVVEFTQDEGHVGIPQPIAKALLDPLRRRKEDQEKEIPTTRTVDPAAAASAASVKSDDSDAMHVDDNAEDQSERTPGHLAYGAFDVPSMPIEICMVRLPKGSKCTLTPTADAIRNNFYALKDIKLVLEQSLIRTRATMAIKDVVHTWHRGIKYDMTVDKVTPSAFDAITCINTDIEVDIGEASVPEKPLAHAGAAAESSQDSANTSTGNKLGGGRTLGSSLTSAASTSTTDKSSMIHPSDTAAAQSSAAAVKLIQEPPADQKQNVCTVQLRSSSGNARRRFDVQKATLQDLFNFAQVTTSQPAETIQLVTRFPRRVFALDAENQSSSLEQQNITQGQEMFMVEPRS